MRARRLVLPTLLYLLVAYGLSPSLFALSAPIFLHSSYVISGTKLRLLLRQYHLCPPIEATLDLGTPRSEYIRHRMLHADCGEIEALAISPARCEFNRSNPSWLAMEQEGRGQLHFATIRDPVERVESTFSWKGPGSTNPNRRWAMLSEMNASAPETWKKWMK